HTVFDYIELYNQVSEQETLSKLFIRADGTGEVQDSMLLLLEAELEVDGDHEDLDN
ncbi:hypothetical protein FRC11_003699, partial [Ceratobasidium sp. 423]